MCDTQSSPFYVLFEAINQTQTLAQLMDWKIIHDAVVHITQNNQMGAGPSMLIEFWYDEYL